ncbi:MAG TPA: YdbL family protein [Caulobacteraceae bacterium]|nr:YdbL family protein [Caulobacteraceae bacterium]
MIRRTLFKAGAAALVALSLAGAAHAQSASSKAAVDAAKDRGVVGEQADGFVGFVTDTDDAALKAAVAEMNAARAAYYRQLAAQRNVPVEAVGAATATQLLNTKVTAGEYYRTADGAWKRK